MKTTIQDCTEQLRQPIEVERPILGNILRDKKGKIKTDESGKPLREASIEVEKVTRQMTTAEQIAFRLEHFQKICDKVILSGDGNLSHLLLITNEKGGVEGFKGKVDDRVCAWAINGKNLTKGLDLVIEINE